MTEPHPPKTLVLASSSPYRSALLQRLHVPFDVATPNIDETPKSGEHSRDLALRLAIEKAQTLSIPDAFIIGSDQTADRNGVLLQKPGSIEKCREQLAESAGQVIDFYTGLALWHEHTQHLLANVVHYRVYMRPFNREDIDTVIAIDHPIDCAGGFKWESFGISLFERMEGPDPTALEGLPLILLSQWLRSVGFRLGSAQRATR